jgi:hypothetical protein
MPSLIPILSNIPRAHKDTLGCEDSTKVKHCANHVNHELYLKLYQLYKCLFGTEPYFYRNTCNLLLEENKITNAGNISVNININPLSI